MIWDMYTDDLLITFGFVTCAAYICGWIADSIMGYAAFGTIGNWLLLLTGLTAGMLGLNFSGYELDHNPILTITVITGTASFLLITMASIKSMVMGS